MVDNNWKIGLTENETNLDGSIYFADIKELKNGELKTFDEAKGEIITNYQNYLEAVWKIELEKNFQLKFISMYYINLLTSKNTSLIMYKKFYLYLSVFLIFSCNFLNQDNKKLLVSVNLETNYILLILNIYSHLICLVKIV